MQTVNRININEQIDGVHFTGFLEWLGDYRNVDLTAIRDGTVFLRIQGSPKDLASIIRFAKVLMADRNVREMLRIDE